MSPLRWTNGSVVPALAPGDVHVWLAVLGALSVSELLPRLSPEERDRAARYHFERDRRAFVAARGLLRGLLGRYAGADPSRISFVYGPRGKPSLAGEPARTGLRFNLSHSGGLALFAFALNRELGVDIERERLVPEADSIAARYFSRAEVATLAGLPTTERPPAFFRCWTRKEAFIKATGDGLSRPLDDFDVAFAPGQPARLLRVEGEPGQAGRWWLEDLAPAPGFAGALAVEGRPARLVCRRWDDSLETKHGTRREGRQDDLQGRGESRGAVLDLAGRA